MSVFQSKTPIMSPVAAQTQCDLFINEAGEDVSHLNISFEGKRLRADKERSSSTVYFFFLLGRGGQAEESKQDANNYYANHL